MGQRAAIYCRVSEDRTGAGLAVERQEAACRELADRLDLTVVEVYVDNDISAYSGKPRPGYRALVDAIRAGQVDAVIVWHLDRLTRQVAELLDYAKTCQARDVPTHSVTAGTLDLSTPSGRMTATIAAAVATAEVERMIERQRAGILQAAAAGRWIGGTRTFGYDADGVTVNEDEAATVRWMAGQVLAGTSLRAIAADLNRRQVPTATGRRWRPEGVGALLQRPRLASYYVHRGEIVGRAEWPPILDEDTWRGVVAILSDPARRKQQGTARKWLLSGLALCGVEGCDLTVTTTSSPGHAAGGQTLSAYLCRSGGHVYRNAPEVDEYIEETIIERLSRPDAADLLAPDQTGDTSALHLRDAALRARLDELGRLYGEGTIDAAQLAQGTAAIRAQREEITAQLDAANGGSVLAGVADAAEPAKVWAGLDLSRKRAIIETLIEVAILPAKRGPRRGRRPGESQFDPASVRVTWKRG
jgi:site-specific DNA recombinase